MSFDNVEAINFMCEARGSQGPETVVPHDIAGVVCATIPSELFIGPGWKDVMPIDVYEDQSALFFKAMHWAAEISCSAVFLETVRDVEQSVVGYRAWIPMDSIAILEYQRVVTDNLVIGEADDIAPKKRRVAAEPPPRGSPLAITTLKQVGDTFRAMYADVSFGPSGTLSLDVGADNSLFTLFSPERAFRSLPSNVCLVQSTLGNYIDDDKFVCPPDLLLRGDMRSIRFGYKGGQGVITAEDLRVKWVRPDIRPTEKVIKAHLMGLLCASGDFKTDLTLVDLRDMMPTEFPSLSERAPYDGPVFQTPLAFYAPISMPITEESDQNAKGACVMRAKAVRCEQTLTFNVLQLPKRRIPSCGRRSAKTGSVLHALPRRAARFGCWMRFRSLSATTIFCTGNPNR